jgi:type I restriction enzyme R subunit
VTLRGDHERRPDLVLYVNGIAVAVIELKNSHVSIGDGIRQLLSNQQKMFHEWFFATVQIVFAGNDSEGLRYGTIGTEEKYFLKWKEDDADNSRFKLDKYLLKMCGKGRIFKLQRGGGGLELQQLTFELIVAEGGALHGGLLHLRFLLGVVVAEDAHWQG